MEHSTWPFVVIDTTRYMTMLIFVICTPWFMIRLGTAVFDTYNEIRGVCTAWHRWRTARRAKQTARRVEREIDCYGYRAGHGTTALHRERIRGA